jgi:enamine deaminase RidA (YjgF/YER057c/UK114 family)
MSVVAARLKELGIELPVAAIPVANYAPFCRAGSLLFVSGQLPLGAGGKLTPAHIGRLGEGVEFQAGVDAARLCAINLIAQARAALENLDLILRVVRLGGFFNASPAFADMPKAMNGASDLMVEIFGERGKHARTTVGVSHLPLGAIAEVEAIFEIA